ncbi:hypothetical protein AgCh_012717 [Apium graveolens]
MSKARKSSKGKSVALKVNDKALKERSVKVVRKKNNLPESDTDDSSSNPDDNTNSETDENMTDSDVMQMAAFLVKAFKRMQFRKSKKNKSFRKKFTGGKRKSTGRRDGKDSKAGKVERIKIKCYNCDEPGHFATECKKIKHDKGKNKALITSNKNWMDSSDSENEDTCYALMASFDDPTSFESKVLTPFFSFDTEDISELKSILKSLHGNFKNKTLENDRLITEIEILKSRNVQLESDLINQIDLKKECERATHTVMILEARYRMLEKDLENERKTLKARTDSGKKKLCEVTDKPQVKSPKRNRNGKQGISKESNYKVVPNAPRKTCFDCGNTNHLAIDCRRSKKMKTAIPESDVRGHMTGNKSQLSEFERKVCPNVSYGDGNVGHTLGYGNLIIGKNLEHLNKMVLLRGSDREEYEAWESTTTTMARTWRTSSALEGGTPAGITQMISSTAEVPPHSTYAATQGGAQVGVTEPQPQGTIPPAPQIGRSGHARWSEVRGQTPPYIQGLAPIPEDREFSGPYTERDSESSDDEVAPRRRRAGKELMADGNQRPRSTRGVPRPPFPPRGRNPPPIIDLNGQSQGRAVVPRADPRNLLPLGDPDDPTPPFTEEIMNAHISRKFKMPTIKAYDGT